MLAHHQQTVHFWKPFGLIMIHAKGFPREKGFTLVTYSTSGLKHYATTDVLHRWCSVCKRHLDHETFSLSKQHPNCGRCHLLLSLVLLDLSSCCRRLFLSSVTACMLSVRDWCKVDDTMQETVCIGAMLVQEDWICWVSSERKRLTVWKYEPNLMYNLTGRINCNICSDFSVTLIKKQNGVKYRKYLVN